MNNELIDLLRTVSGAFQKRMQEQIAGNDFGLTVFQARLINIIGRNHGISQLNLGLATDRDKAQIARAVKELETLGFVARSTRAPDWRTKCLTLTPEGRRIHAHLKDIRSRLAADMLRGLSDEEKHTLQLSLEKMVAAFQN
ncbi:MarR family winged helix-turn-helix transcriptional regulator [Dryocola sp. BD586]|uniref:MarR family winged helix-turn-helix transcriptional regulator n=1 Tax=Dryocola sp. BD586 TaxID=3133271 RepID=UPI003F4F8F70